MLILFIPEIVEFSILRAFELISNNITTSIFLPTFLNSYPCEKTSRLSLSQKKWAYSSTIHAIQPWTSKPRSADPVSSKNPTIFFVPSINDPFSYHLESQHPVSNPWDRKPLVLTTFLVRNLTDLHPNQFALEKWSRVIKTPSRRRRIVFHSRPTKSHYPRKSQRTRSTKKAIAITVLSLTSVWDSLENSR